MILVYELRDRKTGETVCVFEARSFAGAIKTLDALDPDWVFAAVLVRK